MSWISAIPGGVRIQVKVQPRAARNEVAGVAGDHLRVRLTAPPVEGEANRQLQKYLAGVFHCSPGNIRIIRGMTGRLKLLEITGIDEPEACCILGIQPDSQRHPNQNKKKNFRA